MPLTNTVSKTKASARDLLLAVVSIASAEGKPWGTVKGGVRYRAKQCIFHEGAPAFGVFVIDSGLVALSKTGPGGNAHTVALLTPGALFGYRAILTDEPYSVTATTLENSRLHFISAKTFTELMQADPKISAFLARQLGRELGRERDAWLGSTDYSPLARLARALLNIQQIFSGAQKIRLAREELAAVINVNPDTVSRQLSELRRKKAVALQGRTIVILDQKKLRDIVASEL